MKTGTIIVLGAAAAALLYFVALRPRGAARSSSTAPAPQSPQDAALNAAIDLGSRFLGDLLDDDEPVYAPDASSGYEYLDAMN